MTEEIFRERVQHLMDYTREPFSFMTICGKLVGKEFITGNAVDVTCPECSALDMRLDEPEECQPGEENAKGQKEERYGD